MFQYLESDHLVIPVPRHDNLGAMKHSAEQARYAHRILIVDHTDPFDQFPRNTLLN